MNLGEIPYEKEYTKRNFSKLLTVENKTKEQRWQMKQNDYIQ